MKNQKEVLEELESSFLTGLLNIADISRVFPCRSWPDRYFRDHKVFPKETVVIDKPAHFIIRLLFGFASDSETIYE